jgi:Dolichyl-phosphate-mannose-protein mannosyltransferase
VARLQQFRVQLGVVAAGGLAIRLWWVLAYTRYLEVQGDQVYYHVQGQAIAKGAGFVNPFAWNDAATRVEIPSALHPPLYSLYLGLVSALGGTSSLSHRLASCLLGTAVVVVVGLVGRMLAGDRAGVVAALCAALYPNLWINDGVLAAESLYALTIAGVLFCAYRLWRDPSLGNAAWLGAAIAVAALTRAEAVVLFAVLLVPLVLVLRVGDDRGRRVRLLVVGGGVGVVVMAPWVIRNLVQFDQPVLLSDGAGYVVEIANCDETYSGPHLGYWDLACDRDSSWIVQPDLRPGMTDEEVEQARFDAGLANARLEAENEKAKRQVGTDYIRAHRGRFPIVVAARIGRMWELYRPVQGVDLNTFFERRGRASSEAALASYYVLLALSILGLVVLRRRRITVVPFVAIAVMVSFAAALSFGITRYRVGADVALTVLAGVALDAIVRRGTATGHDSPVEGDVVEAGAADRA